MSMKLKALGLAVLAVTAVGAFAVVNASAKIAGHFTTTTHHTIIKGTENGPNHDLRFIGEDGSFITCTHASYEGAIPSPTTTTQSVEVTPTYKECSTSGTAPHNISVHHNGCKYRFDSAANAKHATVWVVCPAGSKIKITHPNCEISVPAQQLSGVTYTAETRPSNKKGITIDVTVAGISAQYHNGLCVFLGTNHTFTMEGSATVWGVNTANEEVSIEHT